MLNRDPLINEDIDLNKYYEKEKPAAFYEVIM